MRTEIVALSVVAIPSGLSGLELLFPALQELEQILDQHRELLRVLLVLNQPTKPVHLFALLGSHRHGVAKEAEASIVTSLPETSANQRQGGTIGAYWRL